MKKSFEIKGKEFGKGNYWICVPLVSKNTPAIEVDLNKLIELNPDLIEWRVDCFEELQELEKIISVLKRIKALTINIPVIFTCRDISEGGQSNLNNNSKYRIFQEALKTGAVDLLDIEMMNDVDYIASVRNLITQYDKKMILSYHNFKKTPSKRFIVEKLMAGERLGGDIVKVALMPNKSNDVLRLLSATEKAWDNIRIPMITMSMGELGKVSRVWGSAFGSEITFASMDQVSAPGQIDFRQMRELIGIISKGGGKS